MLALGLHASAAAAAGPAAATAVAPPAERSVRPGINDSYRSPALDVRDLDSNFAAETREAYAARHAVVKALALEPGERIADVGAGTGIYVEPFAHALKPGGSMYVLDFERIEGKSSAFTLSHVRAGKEVVIREVESAGFEFVREIDLPELEQNYLLQFRRR